MTTRMHGYQALSGAVKSLAGKFIAGRRTDSGNALFGRCLDRRIDGADCLLTVYGQTDSLRKVVVALAHEEGIPK